MKHNEILPNLLMIFGAMAVVAWVILDMSSTENKNPAYPIIGMIAMAWGSLTLEIYDLKNGVQK